jgi:hypothetical protein
MPRTNKLLPGKTRWEIVRASASLAADETIRLIMPDEAKGVLIHIKTASGAAFNATPKINTTTANGDTLLLWTASAAITTDTSTVYSISENTNTGFTGVTASVLGILPREWNLFLDHSAGTALVTVEICYL